MTQSYAEQLLETFGPRVIGLHISRGGDGMNPDWRRVKHGSLPVYTIGRTYLLELFLTELQSDRVKFVDGPEMRRAFEQLTNLETEFREGGTVYTCPPGQHDDLGISCAMLAFAAQHPHLEIWMRNLRLRPRTPRRDEWRMGSSHLIAVLAVGRSFDHAEANNLSADLLPLKRPRF